jgi:Skp family chaperone for outer membrane proteins
MSGLLSPLDDKNVPSSLRQKIALAMLMRQTKYPKTLGEGLSSIGDSIGDAMITRGIYGDAAASEGAAKDFETRILGGGGAAPATPPAAVARSYAPDSANTVAPAGPPGALPASGLLPATPLPPDQQQSNEPNAPVRMPTAAAVQDWRNSVPQPAGVPPVPRLGTPQQPIVPPQQQPAPPEVRPALPPERPAGGFEDRFGASRPGQQSALPPLGTPVMAAGNEPSAEENATARSSLAQALLQKFGPASPPAPAQATPPTAVEPPVIRSAPPPQQAPQHAPVGAGYIPQVSPEPQQPPTMTPLMQRIAEELRNAPPAHREAMMTRAAPLIAQEQAKISRMEEKWKSDVIEHRAQKAAKEQAMIAQQATINADLEARQRIEKGKAPERVTHEGQIFERQKDDTWKDVTPGGGDRAPKLTEGQGKDLGFYERGRRALADLGDGKRLNSFVDWYASGVPVIGNYLVDAEYQGQLNAAREFAAIVLRRESGAAVTDKELSQVIDRYLPKPGTGPELAIQKQYMREGQIQSFRDALGDKGVAADRFDKRFEVERQMQAEEKAKARGGKAAPVDPLEGREAVWPDKTIRVRRNGEWVPK